MAIIIAGSIVGIGVLLIGVAVYVAGHLPAVEEQD